MANVAELKAKLGTLDKIIAEARQERVRAEAVLATLEDRAARSTARRTRSAR